MEGDRQYFAQTKAFNSILNKLETDNETIKFTKDEKTRLTFQLKQNVDYIKKQMGKSWFIKKWMMKSLHKQYSDILDSHFRG
jgi:hypothetical protein